MTILRYFRFDRKYSSTIYVSITTRDYSSWMSKQRRKSPWSGSRTHTSGTSNVGFSNTSHAIYATLPRSLGYLRQITIRKEDLDEIKQRHKDIIFNFHSYSRGSKKSFGSSRSSDTIGCLHIKQSFLKQPLSRFTFLGRLALRPVRTKTFFLKGSFRHVDAHSLSKDDL